MSKIPVQCSTCGRRYAAPASRLGSTLDCLDCGTPIPIRVNRPPTGTHGTSAGLSSTSSQRSASSNTADDSGFVVKLALGVGGGVLALLVIAILFHSSGDAGESQLVPEVATPTPAPTKAAPQTGTLVAKGPDPNASFYERHRWTLYRDPKGRYSVWLPKKPKVEIESNRKFDRHYLISKVSQKEVGTMSFAEFFGNHSLSSPKENIQQYYDGYLKRDTRPKKIIHREWGEADGVLCLDYVISRDNGRTKEYYREFAGDDWTAGLLWIEIDQIENAEEKRKHFFDGLTFAEKLKSSAE